MCERGGRSATLVLQGGGPSLRQPWPRTAARCTPPPRICGVTTGLWDHPGGRVISRCAGWPEREVRAELIAFICWRLVDVGAAVPDIAPRCKHKVSPDLVAEVVG